MSVTSILDTRQYLTFQLSGGVFALDVARVREILEFTRVTKIPNTPDYVRGVINLRGSVVPVIDLRQKCGLSRTEEGIGTCIVVAEVAFDTEKTVIGVLVDSVNEVFELEPEEIEPAPRIGVRIGTNLIKGIGRKEEGFVIILDIDQVFSSEERAFAQPEDETEKAAHG